MTHEPFEIELNDDGVTAACACGQPVEFTGPVRSGRWAHEAVTP